MVGECFRTVDIVCAALFLLL